MGQLSVPQDSRFRQCLALHRGRNFPRHGEHLAAPLLVLTPKSCSDPLRVLGGTACRGKDPEPGRQHALPVNSNADCAAQAKARRSTWKATFRARCLKWFEVNLLAVVIGHDQLLQERKKVTLKRGSVRPRFARPRTTHACFRIPGVIVRGNNNDARFCPAVGSRRLSGSRGKSRVARGSEATPAIDESR
jgi:hypothetical protein